MTAHRAGWRACSWLNFFAFFLGQKIEPATRRWASNQALSQLRGTEPATGELWICTVRDRWIFRCSLCSSNESNYWLILANLMLFRPSLPWGFAAGSGSILGDCLLKMPFWTEGVAGAGQEEKVAKIIPFLLVSEVALGSFWAQFWCFSVLHCHGDLPLGAVWFSATAFWRCLLEHKE